MTPPVAADLLAPYPLGSAIALVAVVALELAWLRTGVFRRPAYWLSMPIVLGFMIPVDGWMTKLSDPIVIYDREAISGVRAPLDIPVEEFVYAVAMLTLAIVLWLRAGRGEARGASG